MANIHIGVGEDVQVPGFTTCEKPYNTNRNDTHTGTHNQWLEQKNSFYSAAFDYSHGDRKQNRLDSE